MHLLVDAFWRAAAYSLHPRVLLLSILPLLVVGGLSAVLGYFYWGAAVASVAAALENGSMTAVVLGWFDSVGLSGVRSVLAPLLVLLVGIPVIVVLCLLIVSLAMTPAIVNLVAARRFPALERRHGAGFWQSAATSIGCTVVALVALALSLPLWLIPPLIVVLPPLIWGWLAYRVMGFDVLAEHASREEREHILRRHRGSLLGLGVATGYAGAAPSLVWAFGALTLVFAPVMIVVAIWLYTMVFLFSALWFAHYALAELDALRRAEPVAPVASTPHRLPLVKLNPDPHP